MTGTPKPDRGFFRRKKTREPDNMALSYDTTYGTFVVLPEHAAYNTATPSQSFGATATAGETFGRLSGGRQEEPPAKPAGPETVPGKAADNREPATGFNAVPENRKTNTVINNVSENRKADTVINSVSENRETDTVINNVSENRETDTAFNNVAENPETAAAPKSVFEKTETETAGEDPESGEIVIDADSGISVDEQREIIVHINGIAEKRRRSLSAAVGAGQSLRRRFKATKHGGLFPLLVNFCAITALVLGLVALNSLQDEAHVQAREGTRIFNTGERAIIEEIRRETSGLLSTMDMEISLLQGLLNEVETQLQELVDIGILTPEQVSVQESLTARRDGYRMALGLAHEERSRILDDARTQEIIVKTQFDVRVREEAQYELEARAREATLPDQIATRIREILPEPIAAAIPDVLPIGTGIRTQAAPPIPEPPEVYYDDVSRERFDAEETARAAAELEAARLELLRITGEQARAVRVENQVAAFFETANRQIAELRFAEAEQTITGLREFLDAPDFLGLQAIQARRELYILAADTLINLLEEKRDVNETLAATNEALLAAREALAATHDALAGMQEALAANGEDPAAETEALIAEALAAQEALAALDAQAAPDAQAEAAPAIPAYLEAELRQEIARLELELEAREDAILVMDVETADSAQLVAQLESSVEVLQTENAALGSQLASLQATNATLNSQLGTMQATNTTLTSQLGTMQATNGTLSSQLNTLQTTNGTLNSQLASLQTTNGTLNSQVSSLQASNTTLQSENSVLSSQMGELQTALSSQQHAYESLRALTISLDSQLNQLRQAVLAQ